MDFMCPEATRGYHRFAADAISKILPDLAAHGFRQNRAEANVTPRGTKTEVHHDFEHHISIAVGMKTRERGPLKLWLLWPSTELRHLASCYADTNAALARMDHGSFLVQMPGEAVIVPPNSPHAVFALESCYLYGHYLFDRRLGIRAVKCPREHQNRRFCRRSLPRTNNTTKSPTIR